MHILQIPVFHVILEVSGCVLMLLVTFEVLHALHVVEAFAVELAHVCVDIIFCVLVVYSRVQQQCVVAHGQAEVSRGLQALAKDGHISPAEPCAPVTG